MTLSRVDSFVWEDSFIVIESEDEEVYKQLPIGDDSKAALIELRVDMFNEASDALAEQVYYGDISIGQWQEEMKKLIKGLHTSVATITKGGWDNMTPRDFGALGTPVREQYKYLRGFAETLTNNRDVSLAYIKNRARLYGAAAGQTVTRTEAGFWFLDHLPWLPRDGSTECLMHCECKWVLKIIEERPTFNMVEAIWVMDEEVENCVDCEERDGHRVVIKTPLDVDVPDRIGGIIDSMNEGI